MIHELNILRGRREVKIFKHFYSIKKKIFNPPYVRFLVDIVENAFGVDLNKTAKSNEYLEFL